MIHHERGESELARESIAAALGYCDTKAVYWNNFGVVLLALGRKDEAQSAFERAVDIAPHYADAHANLGLLGLEQGRHEESRACLARALELDPRHPDALFQSGRLALRTGQTDEAIRLLQAAIEVRPDHVDTLKELGRAFTVSKRYGEAAGVYRQATSLCPTSGEIYSQLADSLAKSGDYEEARRCFRRAGKLRQDRPLWRFRHLGLCPVVFPNETDIAAYRRNLERELDGLIGESVRFDKNRLAGEGFFPSFYLSHHARCNRRLKEKFWKSFGPTFSAYSEEFARFRERSFGLDDKRVRVGFLVTGGRILAGDGRHNPRP